jgi:hypothetical protein
MKIIYTTFLFTALCITFISCENNSAEKSEVKPKHEEVPDGGPCTYEYDTVYHRITGLDSSDVESLYIVSECVNAVKDYQDTCHTTEYAEFQNSDITPGRYFISVTWRLVAGSCNPDMTDYHGTFTEDEFKARAPADILKLFPENKQPEK